MTRGLALPLFLGLALAQVGLLSGPRPPSEVRGTLEGDARQGYRVRVEFLVEVGGNPTQGTTYQSLGWNGQLYLCAPDCGTFRLSGLHSWGTYTQCGRLMTSCDSPEPPAGKGRGEHPPDVPGAASQYRYQVDYAVWPLSRDEDLAGFSPDNPVPLETGWVAYRQAPGEAQSATATRGWRATEPPSGGTYPQRAFSPGPGPGPEDPHRLPGHAVRQFYRQAGSGKRDLVLRALRCPPGP